jgi:hypothetical protein
LVVGWLLKDWNLGRRRLMAFSKCNSHRTSNKFIHSLAQFHSIRTCFLKDHTILHLSQV